MPNKPSFVQKRQSFEGVLQELKDGISTAKGSTTQPSTTWMVC
jgi:hypothetical protein